MTEIQQLLEYVTKLEGLLALGIKIIELRGPSGQELYDKPAREWIERVTRILGE